MIRKNVISIVYLILAIGSFNYPLNAMELEKRSNDSSPIQQFTAGYSPHINTLGSSPLPPTPTRTRRNSAPTVQIESDLLLKRFLAITVTPRPGSSLSGKNTPRDSYLSGTSAYASPIAGSPAPNCAFNTNIVEQPSKRSPSLNECKARIFFTCDLNDASKHPQEIGEITWSEYVSSKTIEIKSTTTTVPQMSDLERAGIMQKLRNYVTDKAQKSGYTISE